MINKKVSNLFLFFLLIINVWFKFYGIGQNSLWLDEAYSVDQAQQSTSSIVLNSSKSDNPPLYYLTLHGWTNIFGISEIAVRSFSAICSILAACFIFILISKNIDFFTGVISSLLFTVSNENLFYAQETRTYAFVVLLTTFSIGLFIKFFRKRNIWTLCGLVISNIALLYSHYLAGFIPVLECVIAMLFYKNNKKFTKDIIIATMLVITLFLPWIQYPFSNRPKEGVFWLSAPTFSNFKGVLIGLAGNKISLIICMGIFVFVSVKKIFIEEFKKINFSFEETSLFIFTFLPIIFVYIIARFVPVFLLRYLLFVSVPFYILFSYLLVKYIPRKKTLYIIASILIIASSFSLKFHPSKDEDWRGTVRKINEIKKEGDIIIISASYTSTVFSYYYDRDNIFNERDKISALKTRNVFALSRLDNNDLGNISAQGRIIGVFCHELSEDPQNTVKSFLDANYSSEENYQFEKVKLFVYQPLL